MKFKKPKPNYKRIAAAVLAIIIALVMVLGMLQPLFASSLGSNTVIEDAQIGFSRMYRMSGYTPFRVSLANGDLPFEGTLRIMVDVSQVASERNFVIYSSPVSMPPGSTEDIEMVIPLSVFRRTHRAILADADGRIVASRTMFASAVDSHSAMVGMLTDNPRGAGRLRWMQLGSDMGFGRVPILNERLIFLDETNFPSGTNTLDNFNMVIIDGFDGYLREEQVDALEEWVHGGGVLVLAGDAINQFASIRFSQTLLSVGLGPLSSRLRQLPSDDMTLTEARERTHVLQVGSGTLIVHEFSLTGEPFTLLDGAETFLSEVYGAVISLGTHHRGFWSHEMIRLTGNLPSFNSPQLPLIFVIGGLYALAIGSVLYIVLKKRDKREAAIYVIPAAAFCVTAVITIVGLGSNYQTPISNTVTRLFLESGENLALADSFTGVHTPASGDIDVRLANDTFIRFESIPEWQVMPRTGRLFSSFIPMGAMAVPPSGQSARITERNEAEIFLDGAPRITFLNRASWSGSHFSQNVQVELDGALHGEFAFEDSILVGNLRNDTGLDLHDVIVVIGAVVRHFEFLEDGGTIELREELSTAPSHFSAWNIVDDVFPFQGLGHNLSPEEGRELHFRRDLLTTMLTGNMTRPAIVSHGTAASSFSVAAELDGEDISDEPPGAGRGRRVTRHEAGGPVNIRVMGYNFDDITGMDINVGGVPARSLHNNFVVTDLPAGLGSSERFDIPLGIVSFTALESDTRFEYHDFSSTFSTQEAGFVELIYNFDARIDLLQISWDTEMHTTGVSRSIYNHRTGEWEDIRREYSDDIEYYINNGELRLRADFQAFSWFGAPSIRLVGGTD